MLNVKERISVVENHLGKYGVTDLFIENGFRLYTKDKLIQQSWSQDGRAKHLDFSRYPLWMVDETGLDIEGFEKIEDVIIKKGD